LLKRLQASVSLNLKSAHIEQGIGVILGSLLSACVDEIREDMGFFSFVRAALLVLQRRKLKTIQTDALTL